jgi:hypothetical protein
MEEEDENNNKITLRSGKALATSASTKKPKTQEEKRTPGPKSKSAEPVEDSKKFNSAEPDSSMTPLIIIDESSESDIPQNGSNAEFNIDMSRSILNRSDEESEKSYKEALLTNNKEIPSLFSRERPKLPEEIATREAQSKYLRKQYDSTMSENKKSPSTAKSSKDIH